MNSPYKTNKVHPEQLIHRTRSDVHYSWERFGFIDGNYKEVYGFIIGDCTIERKYLL